MFTIRSFYRNLRHLIIIMSVRAMNKRTAILPSTSTLTQYNVRVRWFRVACCDVPYPQDLVASCVPLLSKRRIIMKLVLLGLIFLVAFVSLACGLSLTRNSEKDLVVKTKSGLLRGMVMTSRDGKEFDAFVGIPYAETPKRFKVATPVKTWEGIRNATTYGAVCPQIPSFMPVFMGDEDCLFLNVYSPSKDRCHDKLPVLFFIHGGSFIWGSGLHYSPKFLMDECIVFVSINHRVGALGFLTTEDEHIPGNLGLKDALLALRWVHNNIESFRGDKNSITLQGHSSGAAMVSHFLVSPLAKGLFHRIIAQSGSSLNPFSVVHNARANAFKLGEFAKCPTNSSEVLVACLKTMKADDLIAKQGILQALKFTQISLGPVVEGRSVSEQFLPRHPYSSLRLGLFNRVPLLHGMTENEIVSIIEPYLSKNNNTAVELSRNWNIVAPLVYNYEFLNVSSQVLGDIGKRIRRFYTRSEDLTADWNTADLLESVSDRYFHSGILEEAELCSNFVPVFNYVIKFRESFSFSKYANSTTHGDELQYMFPFLGTPEPNVNTRAFEFSRKMIKLWVSFATSGRPSELWTNVPEWPIYNVSTKESLILDIPERIEQDHLSDRMKFWKSLKLRELEFSNTEMGIFQ